jgi:hypothetical protein
MGLGTVAWQDEPALYCPWCADRLNPDGTVTPRHLWMADELDARIDVLYERLTCPDYATADRTWDGRCERCETHFRAQNTFVLAAACLRHNLGAEDPAEESTE